MTGSRRSSKSRICRTATASAIEYTEKVEGKADQFLSLVMQLGTKLNQGLKLPALKTASIHTPAAKNPNQFKAIMAMSRAIEAEDRNDIPKAIVEYKSAIALNPDMDRARVRLASIERPEFLPVRLVRQRGAERHPFVVAACVSLNCLRVSLNCWELLNNQCRALRDFRFLPQELPEHIARKANAAERARHEWRCALLAARAAEAREHRTWARHRPEHATLSSRHCGQGKGTNHR